MTIMAEAEERRKPILISRTAAAQRTGLSGYLIDRAVKEGRLEMVQIGSRKFYRDLDLDELVEGKR